MEIEGCVESVSILGAVHISFQYSIRNPTLTVQVCVICSETTALCEWLVGLQVFVSFPECGVDLSVGVSEVVMGGRFHRWFVPCWMGFLNGCLPIFTR